MTRWGKSFLTIKNNRKHAADSWCNQASVNHANSSAAIKVKQRIWLKDKQKGFTLVETMVTIVLLAIMLSLSVGAYRYFWAGRSLDAAVREITTEIRHAQTMAVASGNTYRINFDVNSNSYVLQSRQGSDWVNDGDAVQLPGSVKFDAASPPSFDGDASVEFYARGVSENGQLIVKSYYGRTKTILLEGEAVNVSVSG